uniref:GIY-YIG domain-containing protein n=1 Tax=Rhabditophanes sp. KR3021 TaxID=114890 RepID=A0AC35TTF7_9BILA
MHLFNDFGLSNTAMITLFFGFNDNCWPANYRKSPSKDDNFKAGVGKILSKIRNVIDKYESPEETNGDNDMLVAKSEIRLEVNKIVVLPTRDDIRRIKPEFEKVVSGNDGSLAKHIQLRLCEEICTVQGKYNANFNAEGCLDKIWPSWRTVSKDNKAYLYFLLVPGNGDNIINIEEASEKNVFYVGESEKDNRIYNHFSKFNRALKNGDLFDRKESRMDKIRAHPAEALHLKLPVPTRELAENLEFILVERDRHQL